MKKVARSGWFNLHAKNLDKHSNTLNLTYTSNGSYLSGIN